MTNTQEVDDALAEVEATARTYRRTSTAHEKARDAAIAAALDALRRGAKPEEVAKASPFTGAYLRRKAREANIPAPPAHARPKASGAAATT